jgi:hypothetical protein
MNDAPFSTRMSQNWLSGRFWPSGVAISRFLIAFSSLRYGSCMRTTRSNCRSPWITWVAALPPIAVSTIVFTSLTFNPYRDSLARSGVIVRLGWPSSRTTVISVMPSIFERMLFT